MTTNKYLTTGIFLLAAFLLLVNLNGLDYWSDEIFSLPKMDTPKVVLAQSSFDVHPPLFFLAEYYWLQMFGRSETAARSLPAIFGLLGIWAAFLIARRVIPENNLKYYLLILATSPFYLFYARMARYYSLTGLLTLLSVFFFLKLLEKRKFGNEIPFWLSSLLLIYTDYIGFIVLLCLGLYYLWSYHKPPKMWIRFIVGGIILLILYLPWISNLFQGAGTGTAPYPADHAAERESFRLIGFIVYNGIQSVVRIFYTAYNFTLGENVYPWNPLIGIGIIGALAVFVKSLRKDEHSPYGFWLFTLFLPFAVYILAVVFYSKVFSASNFALLPSKILFLQPLWLMFLLKGDSRKAVFRVGIVLLLIFQIVSLVNYHRGEQFLNPKYIIPWQMIASDLETAYNPGDLMVTDESPLLHYLGKTDVRCYGLAGAAGYAAEQPKPLTVRLVVRHRGEESIYLEGIKLKEIFEGEYGPPEYTGYVPMTGLQQKLRSRVQGRTIEDYVRVFIFDID
ncbi:MAG: glycosyltransferase family 39 protein [FCB group bacterium]|nr:glycosyltransferase family 39 protein [FCB group bacterium]